DLCEGITLNNDNAGASSILTKYHRLFRLLQLRYTFMRWNITNCDSEIKIALIAS
ncbi:hypothetical protein ACJX0J_023454, partial [Zea mays]